MVLKTKTERKRKKMNRTNETEQKRNKMDEETSKKTVTQGHCAYLRNTRRVSSAELDKNGLSSKDWMINEPKSVLDM